MQFDSTGPIGVYYVTHHHVDTITISRVPGTDSFTVQNLRMGRGNKHGNNFANGERLELDLDWSTNIRDEWIQGHLELIGDSLRIDYSWKNFDSWSSGSTPYNGFVSGSGSR
jgi:hypothetical protein